MVIDGNAGNNILNGTSGPDTIRGFGGNDRLNGRAGDDDLDGGSGTDHLNGGDGFDLLDGGTGADNMDGGDGNDRYLVDNVRDVAKEQFNDATGGIDEVISSVTHTLGFGIENLLLGDAGNPLGDISGTGNRESNFIRGSNDNNVLSGLDGNDTIHGDDFTHPDLSGNDGVYGGNGNDRLFGDGGNDKLYGGNGNDILDGDNPELGGVDPDNPIFDRPAGNDQLYGGNGHDQLHGRNGNDRLFGEGGNDRLDGGRGNDLLDGGSGNDVLNGGSGRDTADYSTAAARVEVKIGRENVGTAQNTGGAGIDTLVNIENLTGSNFDDKLHADTIKNCTLNGGAGHDTLSANEGNYTLNGGVGNDTLELIGAGPEFENILNGGAGADILKLSLLFVTCDYNAVSDSPAGACRDRIEGFTSVGEFSSGDLRADLHTIDLTTIDANSLVAGNQAFTWTGSSPGGAGTLWYTGGILNGNVDGDAAAEFQIQLVGAPALFVQAGNPASDILL